MNTQGSWVRGGPIFGVWVRPEMVLARLRATIIWPIQFVINHGSRMSTSSARGDNHVKRMTLQ